MQLSKEDMFCENMKVEETPKNSTNDLDFGEHGDDVLNKLFWSLHVDSVTDTVDKDVTVAWLTSDSADFSSYTTLLSLAFDKGVVVKGAYLVKNAPLPKGLKRYSRLVFEEDTGEEFPYVTAFVHDGRDEGTPFKGL